MNPKIKILPENIANKIAAGEVVERPASVVKELIENSIDAGAQAITVEVRGGGLALIRVSDNGTGMGREDAVLCFSRHATSKIVTLQDLFQIRTLGFRGEALASIASVAQLEMSTARSEESVGTRVLIEGGKILEVGDTARSTGTTVMVRNLFFNTPARKKFLKSEITEFRQILSVVQNLSLCYPPIAFRLIKEDSEVLNLIARERQLERIADILGKTSESRFLPVHYQGDGVTLAGFIGKPEFAQMDRKRQFFYVNHRMITSRSLSQAFLRAYDTLLPIHKFPMGILDFELAPNLIDVNVHPTKREVRFSNERMIQDILVNAVRRTIRNANIIPDLSYKELTGRGFPLAPVLSFSKADYLKSPEEPIQEIMPLELNPDNKEAPSPQPTSQPDFPSIPEFSSYQVQYFQLHSCFIMTPIKNGLMIIDQHVAHERILYERILDNFKESKFFSQQLLFPTTFESSLTEFEVIQNNLNQFEMLGYGLKTFSGRTVIIEAIPAEIKPGTEDKILREIIASLLEEEDPKLDIVQRFAKSFACRAAIKSGQTLNQQEMTHLVNALFQTKSPFTCPHGRPVVVRLSLDEIQRRFLR